MEGLDADGEGERQRSVAAPRRVLPELDTQKAEPGEEQVYSAVVDFYVAGALRR